MTKQEFFDRRAKLDFERTHGVTKCPPGISMGGIMEPPTPRRRRRNASCRLVNSAQRKCGHSHTKGSDAAPQASSWKRLVNG